MRFELADRTGWGGDKLMVSGWLVQPEDKKAIAWAVLLSGEAVPVAGPTTPDGFVERCKTVMEKADERVRHPAASQPADDRSARPSVQEGPSGEDPPPCLYLAAWLRRAGQDALAVRMAKLSDVSLPERGIDPEDTTIPRRESASYWYGCAAYAYAARADGEARFYLQRMQVLSQGVKKGRQRQGPQDLPQAAQLLAELERRAKEAAATDELPAEFQTWPVHRRVQYLIQQLQEVQDQEFGGFDERGRASDKRLAALIEIGERGEENQPFRNNRGTIEDSYFGDLVDLQDRSIVAALFKAAGRHAAHADAPATVGGVLRAGR